MIILLAAVGLVEAGRLLRDARRARRLNRAMHEVRRPLQAIALGLERASLDPVATGSCLEQARGALRELDAVVNGRREPPAVSRAIVGEVLDGVAGRWRFADVEVDRACAAVEIDADLTRLAAALDNLVANALRHGTGTVRVRAATTARGVRFEVRDGGPATGPARRNRRDPRHGHGLRVVADVAGSHGGSAAAAAPAPGGGTIAAISLPVSGGPADE
jgi:signal transduction histidine kinase